MNYTLRITLRSDLCAGSGEAAGVTVDSDLCTDGFGLPYIPARRLKGVLRAAAELLASCDGETYPASRLEEVFGTASAPGVLRMRDAALPEAEQMRAWLRRTRADKGSALHAAAQPMSVTQLFTSVRGQTRMENGVAAEGSLRHTRVLNHYSPLAPGEETVLEAAISAPADCADYLRTCCAAARHIGLHRNRGLGLVLMTLAPAERKNSAPRAALPEGETLEIAYTVSLDAPVTLPGCGELLREIPARSVIGCMASAMDSADPAFRALFLTGETQWSALTPQVRGARTVPAPLMLTYLKNEDAYCNRLAASDTEYEGKKQKTVDGAYAAQTDGGFRIAMVRSHTVYHHAMGENGSLYAQESLDAGMLYAGTVRVPGQYAEKVQELLCTAPLTFGRSKTAQYAACSLVGAPRVTAVRSEQVSAAPGEPVYVLLQSDLLPECGALRAADAQSVRALLAEALGLAAEGAQAQRDICQFHTISGYQAMWQLQKQQMTAVRGGSVFCFTASDRPLPREVRVGAQPQEGFGLCRVLSQAEMRALTKAEKAPVDDSLAADARHPALESALCAAETRRVMKETARDYEPEAARQELNTGMLGRLRELLAAAGSYEDLLAQIEKIKESDTSSDNTVSRRTRARRMVTGLYERVLDSLRAARLADPAGTALPEDWKLPLEQLLHRLYYRRDRKEGAN